MLHLKHDTLKPASDTPAPHGASMGALATAFAFGGVIALLALHRARALRTAAPAGPADGAPLMRAPLQVVAPVDLKRYAGLWYEQARLSNPFQKSCVGPVTAQYTPLPDGTMEVRNRCQREDGSTDEAVGIARPVNVPGLPGAGRLKVRFLPGWLGWMPFAWGEYWILKLDRDYQVALVGSPDRHYLWVLSRVPDLDEASLQAELDYARTLGFEVDQVVRNAH
jgi:apolipoprotein D and lipocalin family protein